MAPVISTRDLVTTYTLGGTIVRVIAAPGDTLRLLTRQPKQAAAWIASLALFAAAALAVRRRQHALILIAAQKGMSRPPHR